MKTSKLPENPEEIGAFYKARFQEQQAFPSDAVFTALFEKIDQTENNISLDSKKKLNFFLHPKAFRFAASISSIVITSALVLAGSLAVVTVVYDHSFQPQKQEIKVLNNEQQTLEETKKTNKVAKVKAVEPEIETPKTKEEIIEVKKEIESIKETEKVVTPISSSTPEKLVEPKPTKEVVPVKGDNKHVLDEIQEEELFKK